MTLNKMIFLFGAIILILITACKQEATPAPSSVTYMTPPFPTRVSNESPPTPMEVTIKGKTMVVDRVIHGPICNDTWRGVIYVAGDVQVAAWEEEPTFLRDCDLIVEENTIVFVASHNDEQFNKGCLCHE
jgi:hypothetical protein